MRTRVVLIILFFFSIAALIFTAGSLVFQEPMGEATQGGQEKQQDEKVVFEEPFIFQQHTNEASGTPLTISGKTITVEIVDTPVALARGLSGRASLPQDAGLLFVFEQDGLYGIWMKGMQFPIDILWLDESGTVVDIKKDAKPESYPETFEPREPALFVLEVNAGFSDRHEIEIGSTSTLPNMR